jgi:hypothetical protein
MRYVNTIVLVPLYSAIEVEGPGRSGKIRFLLAASTLLHTTGSKNQAEVRGRTFRKIRFRLVASTYCTRCNNSQAEERRTAFKIRRTSTWYWYSGT